MKLHSVVRRAAMLASDLIHIHFSPSLLRSISPSSRTKGPGTASSPGKKAQTWKLVLSGECHEIWWPNLLCSNDFSIQNLVQTWHHTLCSSLFHWIRVSSGFLRIKFPESILIDVTYLRWPKRNPLHPTCATPKCQSLPSVTQRSENQTDWGLPWYVLCTYTVYIYV